MGMGVQEAKPTKVLICRNTPKSTAIELYQCTFCQLMSADESLLVTSSSSPPSPLYFLPSK